MKEVTPGQLKAAEAEWRKANPGKEPTAQDISGQAYQRFYSQAFSESGFGTGGRVQQAMQAATAAVQGLAGGNLAQAITGGSAPYLAEVIHNQTLNPDGSVNVQANLMAHAVVGAVTAYAAGNSAVAGASGAAMGEYIAQQMYPGVDRNDLSEEQRQTISALGTLAAGLAGGVTGDSTAGAVAGAQAGKNAVENNNLSFDEARAFDKELSACKKSGGDCSNIINRYDSINKSNREKMHALVASDPLTALAGQTKWDIDGGLAAASRPD